MIVSKLGDNMTIFNPIEESKAKGKVKKVFDNIKKERQIKKNS